MATAAPEQRQGPGTDPLRHHAHYQHGKPGGSPHGGGSSFMERVSEAVASAMGSVAFLIISSLVILAWVLLNHVITFLGNSWTGLLDGKGFDPAPFILLNLLFSAVAFYTRERNGGGEAPGGTRPEPGRPAAEEHRSHRADPRSGREDDHPDRASPRGHLRAPVHHNLTISAIPTCRGRCCNSCDRERGRDHGVPFELPALCGADLRACRPPKRPPGSSSWRRDSRRPGGVERCLRPPGPPQRGAPRRRGPPPGPKRPRRYRPSSSATGRSRSGPGGRRAIGWCSYRSGAKSSSWMLSGSRNTRTEA
jgi:uncharacterized protein DUF1003